MVKHHQGNPIDGKKVALIHKGTSTLSDVLAVLGAPLEVHAHPDGRILVYRYRARNVAELGIEAETISSFVDVTQTLSAMIGNLSFRWSHINADEDRVVVIIGRDQIVQGIAYREATRNLPVF